MPEGLTGLAVKAAVVLLVLVVGFGVAQRYFLGFMAQRPSDYAATAPAFDIRAVFDGPLVASGVIYGPTGRVASRFVADMEGRWDGTGGTLTEDFRYDSGATQARVWRITPGPDGGFTGTAEDVIGEASGEVSGASAVMRYRLRLPEQGGGWQVDVTDWLYLDSDGVVVNRSQFRRFGILVGELVGTIRPVTAREGGK
jgi:hypothetical protein